jgi:putative FmdB family regulatory protein
MPIFAYRCESCGFQKDVLQKRSDPPLVTCPECAQDAFAKQLTAPAFQLKGSGWYVTDFRDKGKAASGKDGESAGGGAGSGASDKPASESASGKSSGSGSSSAGAGSTGSSSSSGSTGTGASSAAASSGSSGSAA